MSNTITFHPHTAAEKVELQTAIHDTVAAFMGEVDAHLDLEAQADAILANAGFDTNGERLSDVIEHVEPKPKYRFGGNNKVAQSEMFGRLTLAEVNEVGGFIVTYGNFYGMPKPTSMRKKRS